MTEHKGLEQQFDHALCVKCPCEVKREVENIPKLHLHEESSRTEGHYRRLGLVRFDGMNERVWKFITGGEKAKIWID